MTAPNVTLSTEQGSSFEFEGHVKDAMGQNVNLELYDFVAQIRSGDGLIVDFQVPIATTTGDYTLRLDGEQTYDLGVGSRPYDVFIRAGGEAHKILRGNIITSAAVSRVF